MRDYLVMTPGRVWMMVGELPGEHLPVLTGVLEKMQPDQNVPCREGTLKAGDLLERVRIETLIREKSF